MTDLEILTKFVDKREFRNYIHYKLYKLGYTPVKIDDERVCDDLKINDNDITIVKNRVKCTVQTFLNKEIGEKEIVETYEDMFHEDVKKGIIISNLDIDENIIKDAKEKNIEIWGKEFFDEM